MRAEVVINASNIVALDFEDIMLTFIDSRVLAAAVLVLESFGGSCLLEMLAGGRSGSAIDCAPEIGTGVNTIRFAGTIEFAFRKS